MINTRTNRGWVAVMVAAMLMMLAAAVAAPAQIFTTLHSFDSTHGANPESALVQGIDGNFYGTTPGGGANSYGTVFKLTAQGMLITLHSFDGTDGAIPTAPLVQAADGNLYGTTSNGGVNGLGTVFRITPTGTLTTLHKFENNTDSAFPEAGLIQAIDGDFYGTTTGYISGTIFRITPGGMLTTLYRFCSQSGCADGAYPSAALVQATDGNFYGTTLRGGDSQHGTVFRITPSGILTTLHSFGYTEGEGAYPYAAVLQATDGDFYGTTVNGGTNNSCYSGCGTVFKITPRGKLSTLHSFDYYNGASPVATLIQGTDGNLYGASLSGGSGNCTNGCGTIFRITQNGALTMLHDFDSADGADPYAAPIQATDGNFYGTALHGGANGHGGESGYGTFFSLSVGLGPFVETKPAGGKAGNVIKILGTDLTGATSVTFNGTAAQYKVISPSLIGATIPVGATTGPVQVVTPSGTLTSNANLRVLP